MSNIDPKFWGPGLWRTMYSIAESLPNDSKNVSQIQIESVKTFFRVLSEIIPCENCRENYKSDILRIQFPSVVNNKTVGEWIVKINNSVNKKLNIPPVKYENIIKEISDFKSPVETNTNTVNTTISSNNREINSIQNLDKIRQNTITYTPTKPNLANKNSKIMNAKHSQRQRELRIKESQRQRNIKPPVPKNARLNRIVGSQINPTQQYRNGLNVKKPCNCGKK